MNKAWRHFKDPALPKDYFRLEVFVLRWLGIELIKNETLLYSILSKIFLVYTVLLYTGVEMFEVYMQWGNVNEILSVVNYLITHLLGVVKTSILYKNRKKIGEMMLSLHRPPFKPNEQRGGTEEERLIREAIKITETQYFVYCLFVSGAFITGVSNSIYVRIAKPREDWVFPFVPTISFGEFMYHSPYFELGVMYQFWGILLYAGIIISSYVLLPAIMAHISIQMKILGNVFRNVRPRAEAMAGPMKDDENVVNQHMENIMREGVNHHIKTISLAKQMEDLCSVMVLAIFIASVILLCFLLYFISLFPVGSTEFILYSCYWWLVTCQVGLYCYWGNQVSLESENVAKAAAEMDWAGSTRTVTTAVVMVIQRAQRPIYITAGKFVPLSMEVFMKIIKGSFSYFMVLSQTQEMES